MMKTKLIINNKTIHIHGDWTILQACEKIGILIPRFCYSESLSIAGNCRMCLVEIEKSPKLMPSCAIKIANDISIYTKTNLVRKTRERILEFLLINHPLDCPICDQGGECDLQDQAMIYGSDRGRFYEYKRSLEDKNKGPLIKTIMTRCIHCTRCIRFATEIAGLEILGTTGRGKSMEVGSYISNLFGSELSGNVIDLCPVGALTSKPYAFTVRPWELKSIESTDVMDAIGSSIRIDMKNTELMRILPRTNDDLNQQWITDKTRFSYDGLKCQRLNNPMIKHKNGLISVSWKQAMTSIYKSGKFKKGKKITGVIGQFIDQETILTFKRLLNRLGSGKIYVQHPQSKWNTNLNIDCRSNYLLNTKLSEFSPVFGDREHHAHSPSGSKQVSLSSTPNDFILLVGTCPRYEASALNIRLRQLVLKKNVLVASIGFPIDLTYPVLQWGPNGPKTLYQLAQGKHNGVHEILLKKKKPIIILGYNTIEREDGNALRSMSKWILASLKKIHVRRGHQTKKAKHTSCNRFVNLVHSPEEICEVGAINVLHTFASTTGAYDLGLGARESGNESKTDCIYLLGADFKIDPSHLCTSPNNPLVIYQGHHGDLGAKQADIILPSTTYVEKDGIYVNTEGRVQQSQTAGWPQTEARDDWKILHAAHETLGVSYDICLSHSASNGWITQSVAKCPTRHPEVTRNDHKTKVETSEKTLVSTWEEVVTCALETYFENNRSLSWENGKLMLQDVVDDIRELKPNRTSIRTLFDFIAPHCSQPAFFPATWYINTDQKPKDQLQVIYDTSFIPIYDNFYLTDPISRASITMGKCAAQFKTHNFACCF